eukprot:scaffold977_cov286-Pavlova_lutheri.AAC.3
MTEHMSWARFSPTALTLTWKNCGGRLPSMLATVSLIPSTTSLGARFRNSSKLWDHRLSFPPRLFPCISPSFRSILPPLSPSAPSSIPGASSDAFASASTRLRSRGCTDPLLSLSLSPLPPSCPRGGSRGGSFFSPLPLPPPSRGEGNGITPNRGGGGRRTRTRREGGGGTGAGLADARGRDLPPPRDSGRCVRPCSRGASTGPGDGTRTGRMRDPRPSTPTGPPKGNGNDGAGVQETPVPSARPVPSEGNRP